MNNLPNVIPYLLERCAAEFPDVIVTDKMPRGRIIDVEKPIIVLYVQDTVRASVTSWQPVVAYKVYAGTVDWPDDAYALAVQVESWLWSAWSLPGDNPVAASLESNGPNMVPDEHESAVFYGTVEMVTAGVYRPARTG